MRCNFYFFCFLLASNFLSAQNVTFADPNFKELFVSSFYDVNQDNEISYEEALNIVFISQTSDLGITDLTGIEAMTNLESLTLRNNPISNPVDLSSNINLERIDLSSHLSTIPEFNISGLTNLIRLRVDGSFESIDLSNKPALEHVRVISDELQSIDVSGNPELILLNVIAEQVDEIDISNNPLLQELLISRANITEIDMSQNNLIERLILSSNELTSVDLSNLSQLTFLKISSNFIGTIDVSANPLLETLTLWKIGINEIDLENNPLIKKLTLTYNEFTDGVDLSMQTLLEDFQCGACNLDEIDFTNNLELKYVHISSNKITHIDFTELDKLEMLLVDGNKLVNLDLSNNSLLRYLHIGNSRDLQYVNIKNGNNHNVQHYQTHFSRLDSLLEVCVDEPNSSFAWALNSYLPNSVNITSDCTPTASDYNIVMADKFNIYPNPVTEMLYIDTELQIDSYKIYNSLGQVIKTDNLTAEKEYIINLNSLQTGYYMLYLETNKGSYSTPIIKK